MYDIIIKNGLVIDPATGQKEKKDIYVKNGIIVEEEINSPVPEESLKIINADDCYVSPGFIDAHSHVYEGGSGLLGAPADLLCIPNGVTTVFDAGSAGYCNFESFYRGNIVNQMTGIYALLHVSPYGVILPPYEEFIDPAIIDEVEIENLFAKYPELLRGLKIRHSVQCSREFGYKPLEKTAALAEYLRGRGYFCNVTVHFSDIGPLVEVENIMELLREGDIFAHCYQTIGKTIFDQNGKILPCVWNARERGVLFDSSRGRLHNSVKNMQAAVEQNFFPDIISTDVIKSTMYRHPGVSLLYNLSLFYALGMPFDDIIRAVTTVPAKAFGLENKLGSLKTGRAADITIFKIVDQNVTFTDVYGGSFSGKHLFAVTAVVRKGRTLFERIEQSFA